jgi:hypothetical protein
VRRRWAPFLVALGVSAVLAAGVGVAASRLVARAREAPRLRTVAARTLPEAGITVVAASQPPYCDVERGAADHGWTSDGMAGCAIGQTEAEAALLPVFQGHVIEAVLARVTGPATSDVGRDRLVWMLVVQSSLLVLPNDSGRVGSVSTRAVVLVDARSGQVLMTVPAPSSLARPAA